MSTLPCLSDGLVAVVVDDEELACENLRRKLLALDVARVDVLSCPREAVLRLRDSPPHVLFLDVSMPGLSGFEVLAQFPESERAFATVFCTAHGEHAARAFEAFAIDYLVKPVDPTRLSASLSRVRRLLDRPEGAGDGLLSRARTARVTGHLERLVVRFLGGAHVLEVRDVVAFSSEAHRAVAYTADAEHVLELSLSALQAQLDPARFARSHRAHLVQLAHVIAVEDEHVRLRGERRVPLSRRNRTAFLRALRGNG
jgi:two-component system LytT family response regulator